jgi:hypothetical protein
VGPDGTAFTFALLEFRTVSALLWPPTSSVPGMLMPWDGSPLYHDVMSMSSSVGIAINSSDLEDWFMQIGMQCTVGGGDKARGR